MPKKNIDRMKLVQVAEELNKQLKLAPPIDTTLPDDKLYAAVSLASKLLHPLDKFASDVVAILVELGIEVPEDVLEAHNLLDEAKKAKSAKEEKPAPKKRGRKGAAYKPLMEELINAAKYTKKEIVEQVCKEFPNVKKSTIMTVITDSKNPKYTRFKGRILVEDKNGILSFKEA